jgi:hypothetical protein
MSLRHVTIKYQRHHDVSSLLAWAGVFHLDNGRRRRIADRVTKSATLIRGPLAREQGQFEAIRPSRIRPSLHGSAYSFRPNSSIPILFPLTHILARDTHAQIATRSRRLTYHASNTRPSIERPTFPPSREHRTVPPFRTDL